MTVITDARNGCYNENGTITAEVCFDGEQSPEGLPLYLPYTAAAHDPMDYGRQLFADLKAGKYGPVTPFTITPEILTAAKAAKHAEINAWRDTQENGSVIFPFDGHNWDCGKASQMRLAPVVAVAKSGMLPSGFFWTDADNIDVPVTTDELTVLEAAMQQNMVISGFKIHERQRRMKEEVDKFTELSEVRSYNVGWPAASAPDSAEAGK